MGEAVYYLKASYRTNAEAEKARERVHALLCEGLKAYSFWQNNRFGRLENLKAAEEFWPSFKMQFPLVVEMLNLFEPSKHDPKPLVDREDWQNGLAGKLGIIGCEDDLNRLAVVSGVIRYDAEVWHFSCWDHFVQWVKNNTGAVTASWMSSESPTHWSRAH